MSRLHSFSNREKVPYSADEGLKQDYISWKGLSMNTQKAYWDRLAGEWDLIGPPLRPCPEDIATMEKLVNRWICPTCTAAPQGVVLGVTPEIVGMKWPENSHIQAFDQEPAMINSLLPRHIRNNAAAICANWMTLPLEDGYADLVLGDGSLTLLAFPDEYRLLVFELARILSPDGLLLLRLFAAPEQRESSDDIFKDLWSGKIRNLDTFRWRLEMALIGSSDYSVPINDVYEIMNANTINPDHMADTLGWPPLPVARMLERYRTFGTTRHSFPPLDIIKKIMAPHFRLEEVVMPSYQDGERYPIVCFRKI